ncbi:MAG TPA: DUF3667 domain-containing protein [Alphaproteobacteria bacterium]|nr:DUF3667 domain-containing protein [Alphaproteobacteria bacterium]
MSSAADPEEFVAMCANCGAVLAGPFCSACGQSVEAIRRPVWEFIEHTLETIFDFDKRGLRSLTLLFVPGEMTAQYLAGRRARFVPPVRFYIFVSLLFFLAIWATDTAIVQFRSVASPGEQAAGKGRLGMTYFSPLDTSPDPSATAAADKLPVMEVDGYQPEWARRLSDGLKHGVANPALLNGNLSELFPKVMFALVPLFGLFSRGVYLLRGKFLVEHLVFALHFHTFAFLLATVLVLIGAILPGGLASWMFFLPVFAYLLVALRRVFGGSWLGTAVREAVLLLLYGTAFFAGMMFLLGSSLSEL